MKKVLHLLPSNSFSGAENVVCTIIENNTKYDMYYCSPKGPIEEVLKERNIKYIPIKKFRPKYLRKICKENNIDIIHAHDYKASFLASLSNFKGKIISQLHTNWDFNNTWNKYTIVYNIALKKFDKVIVVSKTVVENAVYAQKNKNKFVVIDNVIDKKRVIEKSKEIDTNFYDLIYVGRLCEVKRPLLLLDILKEVKKEIPSIKMCVIGSGDLEEDFKNKIKEDDLEKNVDMLGFKSNPFPYVKNSKVALLTSIHEGLPMSVIECMILGVPVLNSGVDGMSILFKNHPNYMCDDIKEYSNKIIEYLNGTLDLKTDLDKIIEKYVDMDKYIEKINKVYEE